MISVASQFPFLLARPKRDILLELQCAGTAGELLGPEARLCNFEFWNAFTVEGCNFLSFGMPSLLNHCVAAALLND